MKRTPRTVLTALCFVAMLVLSGGCSPGECVPVLRGSEVVFRALRDADDPTLLRVELASGQEPGDVHRDGWYVSSGHMSRIFELLGRDSETP